MGKESHTKFHAWGEQDLPETLDDLIAWYKMGKIGAGEDKESEEALRHDCRQMFGADNLDDIATANGWGDSGAGKLVMPFLYAEKLWPGCFPGTRQFVGSCFLAGAPVQMADGSEKPIEQVGIGELVITHTGKAKRVTKTFAKPYDGKLVHIKAGLSSDGTLTATADHEIAVYENCDSARNKAVWLRIDSVSVSHGLLRPNEPQAIAISEISTSEYAGPVHCLEVEDDHSFLVHGYAVHNCVSHGQTKAMLITLACELTSGMPDPVTGQLEGPPEVPTSSFATGVLHPSPIYWTRGYSGHGWSCSTSARNSVNKVGGVVCKKYPFYDLSEITRDIECLYGSRQPPEDWQQEFGSHLVRGAAEINSFEAIRDALYNGYGVNSCGSEGFSSTRDENGVSKRSGGWAHSMAYTAVDDRDVIKQFYKTRGLVLIQNSWAKWNSGPRRIYGTDIDIPHGSFWARWEDISRRYAVAMSNYNGWPVQILPGWGEDVLLN